MTAESGAQGAIQTFGCQPCPEFTQDHAAAVTNSQERVANAEGRERTCFGDAPPESSESVADVEDGERTRFEHASPNSSGTVADAGDAESTLFDDISTNSSLRVADAEHGERTRLDHASPSSLGRVADAEEGQRITSHLESTRAPGGASRVAICSICEKLSALRSAIIQRFGSFRVAVAELTSCGGEVGGSSRIAMTTLHRAVAEGGCYRITLEVLRVLFSALGVACSEKSTISEAEFWLLSDASQWERLVAPQAERCCSTWDNLQVRRALMPSAHGVDYLLAMIYTNLALFLDAIDKVDLDVADRASAALISALTTGSALLRKAGQESTRTAKRLLSALGLRALFRVVVIPLQAAAGGIDAEVAEKECPAGILALDLVSDAVACLMGAEPAGPDLRTVLSIWQAILEAIDPYRYQDGADAPLKPPSITKAFLGKSLTLLLRLGVPKLAAGPHGTVVADRVVKLLLTLHQHRSKRKRQGRTVSEVYRAFESLEMSHQEFVDDAGVCGSVGDVRAVAAALGGCRLLHETLALPSLDSHSPIEDGGSSDRAMRMCRRWRAERQHLTARFPSLVQPESNPSRGDEERLKALTKAVLALEIDGFETDWELATLLQEESEAVVPDPSPSIEKSWWETCFLEGSIERQAICRLASRWQPSCERKVTNSNQFGEEAPSLQSPCCAGRPLKGPTFTTPRKSPRGTTPPKSALQEWTLPSKLGCSAAHDLFVLGSARAHPEAATDRAVWTGLRSSRVRHSPQIYTPRRLNSIFRLGGSAVAGPPCLVAIGAGTSPRGNPIR